LSRNPDTVRALDIAFLSKSTLSKKSELSKYWEGAPDLAIEILSPNDTQSQLEDKAHELLEAGTKAVWVVDPKRKRVWIHKSDAKPVALESNDFLEGESILPGFRIQVGSIFEDD
jgi:Uma2 family endonuclease